MADNILIDNGSEAAFTASTDLATSGHVQRVKLTYSGDGLDTHVSADASGLLVNLGANNDVTLTSGTLTAIAGTVVTSFAGTPTVNIAGGTTTFSGALSAGSELIGYVGLSADGTAIADILSLTNGTAVAVGLYDSDGDQVSLAPPVNITATLTNGTAAYSVGDTMGTAITLAGAAIESGGLGHIIGARCFVTSNVAAEDLRLWVFDTTVTPSADNAAFNITTTDIVKTQGIISFEDWYDGGTAHVSVGRLTPVGHPLAYVATGSTNLYAVMESRGTGTYSTATVSIELIAQPA